MSRDLYEVCKQYSTSIWYDHAKVLSTFVVKTNNILKFLTFLRPESWTMEIYHSSYFQNEEILVQLDELDKLDRITYA